MMPGSPGRSSSNNSGNNSNNPNNNPSPGGNPNPSPGGNPNQKKGLGELRRRKGSHSPSRLYERKGWQVEPSENEYEDTGGYASDDTSIPKVELKSLKLGYNVSKIGRSIEKLDGELKKINESGISNRIIRIKKINPNSAVPVTPYPENEYLAYNNSKFFVENGQDITKNQLANLSNIYAKGAARLDAAIKLDADARTYIAGLSAKDKRLYREDIEEIQEYRLALPSLIEK